MAQEEEKNGLVYNRSGVEKTIGGGVGEPENGGSPGHVFLIDNEIWVPTRLGTKKNPVWGKQVTANTAGEKRYSDQSSSEKKN